MRRSVAAVSWAAVIGLGGCAGSVPPRAPAATDSGPARGVSSPAETAPPSGSAGVVIGAPGASGVPVSEGQLYPPNPAAIVVFIDAGHGGCLDWGVPNPFDNTVERAEKTMTLAIALALRDRLEGAGAQVVLSRDDDEAVAGDVDPAFGCDGAPFRDTNADGEVGFDPEGRTLVRDELTARIDLANLARADVFISVHVNSMTENAQVYEIAATQTFYTDETAWGAESARLAELVQREVVASLDAVATYERQDRGTAAVNYYVIAPPLTDVSAEEYEPRARPRGIQMPGVLAEVGSMSLDAESALLAGPRGQAAVADGLFRAIAAFLGERERAVRYDALIPGGQAGRRAPLTSGDGPPFVAPELPPSVDGEFDLELRLANTGTRGWPDDLVLLAGWQQTDEPYLNARPDDVERIDVVVPPLAPGDSVLLPVTFAGPAGAGRHVAWISLAADGWDFAALGSPALQLATPDGFGAAPSR